MADSSLNVKVTAEIADLQAKMALAQANVRAFASDTRAAADAMRAAGDAATGDMGGALEAAATKLAAARAEVAALHKEIQAASGTEGGFGALRESVASAIEPLTGMAELFGVGFGIEELVSQVKEAVSGFAELGSAAEHLAEASGLSIQAISGLRVVAAENDVAFDQITRAVTTFSKSLTEAQGGSKEQLAILHDLGITNADLAAHGNDVNYMLEAVAKGFDKFSAGAAKDDAIATLFGARIQGMAGILHDLANEGMAGAEQHAEALGASLDKNATEKAEQANRAFVDLGLVWDGLKEKFAGQSAGNLIDAWAQISGNGDIERIKSQIDDLNEDVTKLRAAIPTDNWLKRWLDQSTLDSDIHAIDQLTAKLQALQTKENEAPKTPSAAPAQSSTLPQFPANFSGGGNAAEQEQLDREVAENKVALGNMALENAKANLQAELAAHKITMDEYVADMKAAVGQQEAIQKAALNQEVASTQAGTAAHQHALDQIEQLEAKHNNDMANLDREAAQKAAQEKQQLDQETADNAVALGRMSLDTTKQQLDDALAAHKISVQQWVQDDRGAADQQYAIEVQALQEQLDTLQEGTAAYKRVYDEIEQLAAKHQQDLASIQREGDQKIQQQVDQANEAWLRSFQPVENAFDRMLNGILTGTQTYRQAAIKAADDVALSEIEADAKAAAQHLLINLLKLNSDKATDQGGVLFHLLAEREKTTATATGAAQRTATNTAANAKDEVGFLAAVGKWIAGLLGFDAANDASATNQVISSTAADKAATISAGSRSLAEVADAAAVAAANAYAATAAIPYVGPVLAPAAAATAFAGAMSWGGAIGGSVASAEGGMWTVPQEMLSVIHPQESILPANVAGPMRDYFTGGGAAASGQGSSQGMAASNYNITMNVTAFDAKSVTQMLNDPQVMRSLVQNINNYQKLNPSVRGS